jgi:hypothetical protein
MSSGSSDELVEHDFPVPLDRPRREEDSYVRLIFKGNSRVACEAHQITRFHGSTFEGT